MKTVDVRARIDPKIKRKVVSVLDSIGLNVSDAIRLLMLQIATEKRLPFELKKPNKATIKAIEEINKGNGKRFSSAEELFKDLKLR